VARQDERIAELERRLNRSSRNSSARRVLIHSRRLCAAGIGRAASVAARTVHEGHGRPLLPAWAVDEVIEYWPARCGCGHVFSEDERVAAGDPARHQVERAAADQRQSERAPLPAAALS
jgi:hypothetical protein